MADGATSTTASACTAPRIRVPRSGIAALFIGTAALALVGAGAAIAQAGAGTGTAVYWMTADTTSGMGSMMAGGGGSAAVIQAMMGGGGGQASYAHLLSLQLGSPRKASPGEPAAEHLPPPGLRAGASLPLVTPQRAPAVETGPWNGKMEKPKGRILIYWGCGDRARPGQPVVIDFATLSAGKMPPAFATMRTSSGPAWGRHATYGEWPNQRSPKPLPADGSLVGEHVVRGNYTPEIKFTLAQGQDFLAPVAVSGNQAGPSGSVPLAWRPVSGAKAWFVATMGAAQNGDMVMWSSSETQAMPMMMAHLPQDEIARLVTGKVLLPASAMRCTVPAEVAKASQSAMLTATALGGEANFSHPARPPKAPASWRPDWTVKLLANSSYTGLLGVDMAEMTGGGDQGDGGDAEAEAPKQGKKKKRNPFGGLGGIGNIIGQ
ncbi:MAG: hypothetical protein JWN69_1615 [Alphaproteobacteria bacterium]|nr:hypothetical protein [Alphaproteobacteria bacterium]